MRILMSGLMISMASPILALTTEDINAAVFDGAVLPDGQSGLAVKLQVLLDRAGVSPGVIDGYKGAMSESALRGYEAREGLPVDGVLDSDVWTALGGTTAAPTLMNYTITQADVSQLSDAIPDNVTDKAAMDKLGFTSVTERLSERFHMDEDFLKFLNPDVNFTERTTITVTDVGPRFQGTGARVEIRKSDGRAVVFDADDRMLTNYPVAIGSQQTPSPQGTVEVTAVAMDPTYTYRPDVNFVADGVEENLILPAGPNGPVGAVWIDLSEPTYGLHGTDTPAALFTATSHGCVRFTNWDVTELAYLVSTGVIVEFIE